MLLIPGFYLLHQLTIDTVSFIANGVGLKKKAAASEAALAMLAWLVNNEPDHLHHLSFEELSLRGYERLNARQLLFPDDGLVPISLDCVTTGRKANASDGAQKRKTTEPSLDKEVLNNEHLPSKKKPTEKKKEEVGDNFVNLFPVPLSTDDDDNCDLPPPKSKSKAARKFQKFKKSKLNRSPFPPPPAPNPNPLEIMTTPGDVSNPSESLASTDAAAAVPSLKRTSEVEGGGGGTSPLKSPAAKRKKNRRRADPKNGAFAYSPSHSSSSSLSVVSNLVANLSIQDDPTLYLSPPSHPPESLVRILPADHTFTTADDDSQPTPLFLRAVCHNDLCRHPDHLDPGKHQKHQVLLAECQASSKTLVELLGSS